MITLLWKSGAASAATLALVLSSLDPRLVARYNLNLPVFLAMILTGLTLAPLVLLLRDHVAAHPDQWPVAVVAGVVAGASLKDGYEGVVKAVLFRGGYVLEQHALLMAQWLIVAATLWGAVRLLAAYQERRDRDSHGAR